MRIGLIASPFISVPPPAYGGTELFVANLAEALIRLGASVTVYTNGESTVKTQVRWLYPEHEWPFSSEWASVIKEVEHNSWAFSEADRSCDIVHVNSALAVPLTRLTSKPVLCTLHHPFEASLAELYARYKHISYVSISKHQASLYRDISSHVVHHGIDVHRYRFSAKKQPYLCFLGRICPIKGTHTAIEIAKRAGIPLKIAGEVQPIFRDYFETKIRPYLDGKNVEFVGEVDFIRKNELLSNATALLFPIEWDEPFGLVMIEAMACGTPVIALPGGAVPEIVADGVSGKICCTVDEAVAALYVDTFNPYSVRQWAEKKFSADTMAKQYYRLYAEQLEKISVDSNLTTEETVA